MSFVLLSKKEAHLQALFSDDSILDFHDPKIHARNKLHETFLHYFTNFSAILDYFLKGSMLQNDHNLAKMKKTHCTQTAKLLSKSILPAF